MKPSIFYSSRQPYLKYLAIILTTITIYVLTHSSYLADPNINDVTTKPILETVPQPPPQSPSSPEQQQQQPANQDQIVKVPEELKNKPQDLVVDNNKDQNQLYLVYQNPPPPPHSNKRNKTPKRTGKFFFIKRSCETRKVKATFVTLARNSELYDLIKSIRNVEDRFNRKFNYDWVFLNDDDFTQEFKDLTTALVSGKTKYGKILKNIGHILIGLI